MTRYIELVDVKTNEVINTYDDLHLILGHKSTLTPPSIKENYVDVPGGDGSLDLTEATGNVNYSDRIHTYPFSLLNKFNDLPMITSKISNLVHGKKFKIFHWDDPDFYYIGRVKINNFSIDKAQGSFNLEATCEPYKYKKYITELEYNIVENKTIVCTNLKKRVVPIFTLDSTMSVTFNNNTYTLSEGTHQILNIFFDAGAYELKVKGNGKLKISYQEASL